jgi:hypothetical protein
MLTLGDSYETVPPSGAALVLTDPPYGTTHNAWDDRPDHARLWALLDSFGCPVVSFGGFRLIAGLAGAAGDAFRYDLIWEKSWPVGYLNSGRQPLRDHETIGVFGREAVPYRPQRGGETLAHPVANVASLLRRGDRNYGKCENRTIWMDDGTRSQYSVLHAGYGPYDARRNGSMHPTAKPVDLLRMLIRMYSEPGDLVCDPFAGSGSTGVAAKLEGRSFFGVERDPKWFKTASSRIESAQLQPTIDGGDEPLPDMNRFAS